VSPSVVISISFAAAHRQREREGRADSPLALHPDPPAVQLDELARERQPEPGALDPFRRRPGRRNSSNTASWSSGAMPTPVSVTEMSARSSCRPARTSIRPPSGVKERTRGGRGLTRSSLPSRVIAQKQLATLGSRVGIGRAPDPPTARPALDAAPLQGQARRGSGKNPVPRGVGPGATWRSHSLVSVYRRRTVAAAHRPESLTVPRLQSQDRLRP
jgi:hypothetical protein